MRRPLFSVILATYNRQDMLTEAVDSVLKQTVSDFELIVVDDASPHPVRVYDDTRVRLIRREVNGGLAAARNTALGAASGQHLTFIDDDDLYTPKRLELALMGLKRAPIALCWFTYVGEQPHGRLLNGMAADELLSDIAPALGATAVRRDIMLPFDESYRASSDLEWWVRMAEHPVTTVPEVGYLVRRHSGVRSGNPTSARMEASLRLLVHHEAFFGAHPSASAFRWSRIGVMSAGLGERKLARHAFLKALRIRPNIRILFHLVRSLRP